MSHEYQPDPKTGRCLGCPTVVASGRGYCRWCGHAKAVHTGKVPPEVRAHYAYAVTVAGREEERSKVSWEPSACSVSHCACRRYES